MKNKKALRKEIFQWLFSLVIAVTLALTINTYVFARSTVSGLSMLPTLKNNDSVLVEKLSLITMNIKRGQIIIFNSENQAKDIFVKRVIGIEGDEVELKANKVYLNGTELKETYLEENTLTKAGSFLAENQKLKIAKGFVFVLGDNRQVSNDSRYLGPISIKEIDGHVVLRAYPFNSIKTF
ncbi:MAG: signal peptidase I [Clostridiaceae bacterium]|nr:signal peptidase I [Clostridiaceae bacterium]